MEKTIEREFVQNKDIYESVLLPLELDNTLLDKLPRENAPSVVLKLNRKMFNNGELDERVPKIVDSLKVTGVKVAMIELPSDSLFNLESCLVGDIAERFFLPPIGMSSMLGDTNEETDIPKSLQLNKNVGVSEFGKGSRLNRPTIIYNLGDLTASNSKFESSTELLQAMVESESNPLTISEEISMHIKVNERNIELVSQYIDQMKEINHNFDIYLCINIDNVSDFERYVLLTSRPDLIGSLVLSSNITPREMIEISMYLEDNNLNIAMIVEGRETEEFNKIREALSQQDSVENEVDSILVWQ